MLKEEQTEKPSSTQSSSYAGCCDYSCSGVIDSCTRSPQVFIVVSGVAVVILAVPLAIVGTIYANVMAWKNQRMVGGITTSAATLLTVMGSVATAYSFKEPLTEKLSSYLSAKEISDSNALSEGLSVSTFVGVGAIATCAASSIGYFLGRSLRKCFFRSDESTPLLKESSDPEVHVEQKAEPSMFIQALACCKR